MIYITTTIKHFKIRKNDEDGGVVAIHLKVYATLLVAVGLVEPRGGRQPGPSLLAPCQRRLP